MLDRGANKEAKDWVRGEGRGGGWKIFCGAVRSRGCVEQRGLWGSCVVAVVFGALSAEFKPAYLPDVFY